MRTSGPFPTPRRAPPPQRPDVAVCYGTRPQVIKASRLVPALRERWNVITVDTGQHYDYALNAGLYDELGVPAPSVFLDVGAGHPVEQTARIAAACSQVLIARRPRVVVVIGDTNSTLGSAVAAAQAGTPIVHVEAGLRSGVPAMAEERNRIAVDAMSRLLCAPSEIAMRQLRHERLGGEIVYTGDVSRDVLVAAAAIAPRRGAVRGIPSTDYVLATLHRAELADDRSLLADALDGMGTVGLPVVLPLHPRTERRIQEFGLAARVPPNVCVVSPFGYLQNLAAIRDAELVITDSGGVQREAYWMGVPCVTLRGETEWSETIDCGANRLVAPGGVARAIGEAVAAARSAPRTWSRNAYGTGDAAERIAHALADTLFPARRPVRPFATT